VRISLPSSKSISNRLLVIAALAGSRQPIGNLSSGDDTRVMEEAFRHSGPLVDAGHAGTAMRFLTAYLARTGKEHVLTGSQRMKQRPVGILVEALNQLGARIEYLENRGFPPLKIGASVLSGGTVEMDGSVSSQFISALLMIAPTLPGGLTLRLTRRVTSFSYIRMTLRLMEMAGVRCMLKPGPVSEIRVPEQPYRPVPFTVEADWSAASYWYEILAFCPSGELELENLRLSGLQGDEILFHWFEAFGIKTVETPRGITLLKTRGNRPSRVFLKFHENPDLAQTMAVLCVGQNIPFHFSGLETLKIKETNRVSALAAELAKFGARLSEPAEGELKWDGRKEPTPAGLTPVVETYLDHRMAMAFAPLALTGQPLLIADPGVVTKSYPDFWDDLRTAGFTVNPEN